MKIILSFDIEGNFHKYIHSPYIWHDITKKQDQNIYSYNPKKLNVLKNYYKWKLVNKFKDYSNGTDGFSLILDFLKKSGIPASLNLCGYLYLKKKDFIPIKMPFAIGKLKKDPYYWQNNSSKKDLDFSSILERTHHIDNKDISFGLHGFIHEAFPLEDDDTRNLILKKGIDAANELGVKIDSFVPPFNMSFNNNSKEILNNLKKYKIKSLRTIGNDDYFKTFSHKREVKPLTKINDVNIVHLSSSIEGTFKDIDISQIINNIKSSYDKNKIFCIMSHDYTYTNNSNLFKLLKEIDKISKSYPVRYTNLKWL